MVNAWLQTTYIRISQLEIKTYVKEVENLCTFCILVLYHTIFIKFQTERPSPSNGSKKIRIRTQTYSCFRYYTLAFNR